MSAVERIAFGVDGMDCPNCASRIAETLNRTAGVEDAQVDFLGRRARVAFVAETVSARALYDVVRGLGYHAIPNEPAADADGAATQRTGWMLSAIAAAMWVVGFALHQAQFATVARIVYVATIAVAGAKFARSLYASIRERRVDEHVLMGVSIAGALALGEWSEAAALVVLLSVSEFLDSLSVERARRAIRGLMSLTPTEATVRRGDGDARVPVASVAVGETVRVRPGERIPLDGKVTAGESAVNESSLTGESRLVEKRSGSDVFAGTVNDLGSFDFVVAKAAGDTTLDRIIRLVEEAQRSRSRSERFVDRFARYYTPVVVIAAALVTVVPVVLGAPFGDWFYRSLVVLMVGCPCALVLSTPVTILAGLARAARSGILIKGGIHLENLGTARIVAFDKTGTLTKGEPVALDVVPVADGCASDDLLGVAASVESRSEHLHATAIVREANRRGVPFASTPVGFRALPGKGAIANVAGTEYVVGSVRLFDELGAPTKRLDSTIRSLEDAGRSVVLVGTKTEVLGVIGIGDELRDESVEVIAALRQMGIARTVMLTGDHRAVAAAVGAKVGVDEAFADLLPHEKAEKVAELAREYGSAIMVGDGINDAPALASATVGVAVGGAGNDIVIESADATLMSGDLRRLPMAIRIGRRSRALIVQNVVVAVASKAAVLVLAAVGIATLWMAVLADVGVSLLVVLNGLRALRTRSGERGRP